MAVHECLTHTWLICKLLNLYPWTWTFNLEITVRNWLLFNYQPINSQLNTPLIMNDWFIIYWLIIFNSNMFNTKLSMENPNPQVTMRVQFKKNKEKSPFSVHSHHGRRNEFQLSDDDVLGHRLWRGMGSKHFARLGHLCSEALPISWFSFHPGTYFTLIFCTFTQTLNPWESPPNVHKKVATFDLISVEACISLSVGMIKASGISQ